jgi:hypothetical protein
LCHALSICRSRRTDVRLMEPEIARMRSARALLTQDLGRALATLLGSSYGWVPRTTVTLRTASDTAHGRDTAQPATQLPPQLPPQLPSYYHPPSPSVRPPRRTLRLYGMRVNTRPPFSRCVYTVCAWFTQPHHCAREYSQHHTYGASEAQDACIHAAGTVVTTHQGSVGTHTRVGEYKWRPLSPHPATPLVHCTLCELNSRRTQAAVSTLAIGSLGLLAWL